MRTRHNFAVRAMGTVLIAALGTWAFAPAAQATIVLGQFDNFQDGTTMGWSHGPGGSPNPPSNIATGGPAGVGDRYVQNTASGLGGAGGRHVMLNRDQWTGDYIAAGVTRIDAMVRNPGSTDLWLRAGVEGDFFERYASTTAFHLPAGSGWTSVSFDLSAAGLSQVAGDDALTTVLSNVSELRILSNASLDWVGTQISSILGADNITAAPEPGSLALVVLGAAALIRRRA